MEIEELLSKIGLNKNESAIYLALLNNGPMTVAGISQKSSLHRPTIYKTIPNLEKTGLITNTPYGKLKKYVAENPQKLKTLLDNLNDKLSATLPDLEVIYKSLKVNDI